LARWSGRGWPDVSGDDRKALVKGAIANFVKARKAACRILYGDE
jgi:hypothetical protein